MRYLDHYHVQPKFPRTPRYLDIFHCPTSLSIESRFGLQVNLWNVGPQITRCLDGWDFGPSSIFGANRYFSQKLNTLKTCTKLFFGMNYETSWYTNSFYGGPITNYHVELLPCVFQVHSPCVTHQTFTWMYKNSTSTYHVSPSHVSMSSYKPCHTSYTMYFDIILSSQWHHHAICHPQGGAKCDLQSAHLATQKR